MIFDKTGCAAIDVSYFKQMSIGLAIYSNRLKTYFIVTQNNDFIYPLDMLFSYIFYITRVYLEIRFLYSNITT